MEKLKGTDKFLLLYDLSKLNQEDVNNSGSYVMSNGIERVIASQESQAMVRPIHYSSYQTSDKLPRLFMVTFQKGKKENALMW